MNKAIEDLDPAILAQIRRDFASSGGTARAEKLSRKRIKEIASIASKARWKKFRDKRKSLSVNVK